MKESPLTNSFELLGISVDSGLDAGLVSPTSSQTSFENDLTEAYNSELCVISSRLSPVGCCSDSSIECSEKETNNLVEEVYVAKQSISKGLCLQQVEDLSNLKSLSDETLILQSNHNFSDDGLTKNLESLESVEIAENGTFVEKVVVNIEDYRQIDEINNYENKTINFDVVVSIDLGTTYSGYAYAFTNLMNDKEIHIMRQNEGGDRGLNNQKIPTILLLTPDEKFHSFGYAARETFHDLDDENSKKWLYFDKFKMELHNNMEVNRDTEIKAQNGKTLSALYIFSLTLKYFKNQFFNELTKQYSAAKIRWIITVPALWTQQAKQFIKEAAYMANFCSPNDYGQIMITLEPEAASTCCRYLHFNQIRNGILERKFGSYMVVDCGGGTVDITIHSVASETGTLRELHKATGGPCGSLGVDEEFCKLLDKVFGTSFMQRFKMEKSAAYNELMLSFECRKRSASPFKSTFYNIFPPFAFIDFYHKITGSEVETAIKRYGNSEFCWSDDGIIRIHPALMLQMFQSTINKITQHIDAILKKRTDQDELTHMFLVGGFSESQIVQQSIKDKFSSVLEIVIPPAVSLCVLKGGVLFGLNPAITISKKISHTYGLGVVKPFLNGIHPPEKLVIRRGQKWCVDVFEKLVESGQIIPIGDLVSRKYTPATNQKNEIILNIYSTISKSVQFVTDNNVEKCGTLRLNLPSNEKDVNILREIVVSLTFGATNVTAIAVDTLTGMSVKTLLNETKKQNLKGYVYLQPIQV